MSAPSLLVVAGEASADVHGARVIERLRESPNVLQVFGLGGERMLAQGLEPVADGSVLSVVGVSEALRQLGAIRRVFRAVTQAAQSRRPAAALLMDLPDFNLRLARVLCRLRIPVVYYIAPQAWAWRKGRVRQLRRRVAKLCVTFPFEQDFFARYGVPVEFVGHPLCEIEPPRAVAQPGRVAIVPGSRPREIERLLPPLAHAARLLQQRHPELRFFLPLAPGLDAAAVRSVLAGAGVEAELTAGGATSALAGARLALVTSGTATLEAALCGVPMVVVYRVSRTTAALVRLLGRIRHVCIVNILAGAELVPELLQGRVEPALIAERAEALLADSPARDAVICGLRDVAACLGQGRPSTRVAQILSGLVWGTT